MVHTIYGFLSGAITWGFGSFVPKYKAQLELALDGIGGAQSLYNGATSFGPAGAAVGAAVALPLAFVGGFSSAFSLMGFLTGKDPPADGMFGDIESYDPNANRKTITSTQSATSGALQIVPVSTSITTDQNRPAAISISVQTNVGGEYSITATAPEGWLVKLTNNSVTVTPAPGTQSGTGTVRLVVRSNSNPDRVARADVAVVVTPTVPGMTLDVVLDPLTTVPFLNAQLPTSYEIVVRNLGPASEPYTLTFSNVTPGWEVITTAAGLSIPAGMTGIRGVYLRPTGTTIPAPGTPVSFTMTVTSATNPARTQAEVVSFAMPEVAATVFFPSPAIVSTFPGATVNGIVSVQNNGNISQTVTLSAGMLPTGFTLGGLPQTLTLAPRDVVNLPYTLAVASTVQLFATASLHLSLDKTQTGATEAYALDLPIRVVVPGADAIANAGLSASQLGKLDLADRLGDLSTALTNLVLSPTDPIAKSQSVAALDAVIAFVHADPFLSIFNNDFDSARTQLVDAVTLPEVQAAVERLGGLLDSFAQLLGDAVRHGFTFGLVSNVVTALPSSPARFPILLENKGTQATTFDLSVGGLLPFGTTATFSQSTVTLQPGERLDGGPSGVTLSLTFTSSSIFPTGFTVIATPQEAPSLVQRTSASVAVRAEFIQVANVTPSPAFTEPGGLVAISARILNVVNRDQVVLVSYRVTDTSGSTVFASAAQAVTLNVQSSLIDVALPGFDTTSLARNDYTITVMVTDVLGAPLPGGSGQVSLLVGTPVSATLTVSPDSLLAIDSTVTNTLRLESHSVFSNPLTLLGQVQTLPTATTILVRGDIAYVAGTNGIDIVNVANPSAPQIVGTFGQGLIVQGGFTVVRALSGDRIIVATRGFLNAAAFTLLTYSVANPTAPVLLGQSSIAEAFISDLFIVDNRALATTNSILFIAGNVISQSGDVLSLDLTSPSASTVTDELFGNGADNFNQNGGEVVDASTLYVASTTSTGGFSSTQQGNGVVRVIDYSDPANLSQIRKVTIPGTVQVLEIAVEGNRALVVGSTGGWKSPFLGVADAQLTGRMTLTLLDITDHRNPVVLGTTLVTESLNRPVDTADGGAKLSTLALGNGRFAISRGYVDGRPVLLLANTTGDSIAVASIDVPSLVNEMAMVNDKLYTTSQAGLLIYNVGNIEGTTTTVTVHVPNSNTFPNVNHVRVNSFNIPPDQIIPSAGFDTLVWNRPLAFGTTSTTLIWQTDISGLVPGESRDVTTGTDVSFVHAGTPGAFALPATSVVCRNAVAISPASQTVAQGAPATYTVTLTNPTNRFLSFNLSTSGVLNSWVDLPRNVVVNANSTDSVTLRITAPATTPNSTADFVIFASANGSVQGTAQGTLVLDGTPILPDSAAHGVVASIAPSTALAGQGTNATYVVRLTNTGSETETFALSSVLPVDVTGSFESTVVTIPPGKSNFREITLVLRPAVGTATGQYPFTVKATSTSSGATNSVSGEVQVVAKGVRVKLNSTTGIPGDTFQITVTNTGTVADTFDLNTAGPAGVSATLGSNQLTLAPNQSQVVDVTTAAVDFVVPGTFNLTVFARSRSIPAIADSDSVELDIRATTGLASHFDPAVKVLSTPGTANFLLFVDNIGNTEDAYTATISATNGPIAASLIGLDGKPTQTIPIFRLPGLASGAITLNAGLANAGQGTVRIQVRSLTDGTLLSESTATLSALAGVVTTLTIAATSADKAEGNSGNTPFTFTIARSGNVTGTTTVEYTVAGSGNSPADADDTGGIFPSGLLSFAANETSKTVTINVRGDLTNELDERFTVTIFNASDSAAITVATAAGTIRNDDSEPGFRLTCASLHVGLNTCTVQGGTPRGMVNLAIGIMPGNKFLQKFGVTLGMQDPTIVAQGIVQPDGRAVVQFNIATQQLLEQVLLQAFEQVPTRRTSNIVIEGFPLLASGGQLAGTATVSPNDLPVLLAAAIARWKTTGLTFLENQLLNSVTVEKADLPAEMLGRAVDQRIYVDNTAAGHGWFVDRTPTDDSEFNMHYVTAGQATSSASVTYGRVDLLTVMLHELGHILGRADLSESSTNSLMLGTLPDGTRRTPDGSSFTDLQPLDVNRDGFVSPLDVLVIINQLNLLEARTALVFHNQYDVNQDGFLSPIDALLVINYLNRSIQNSNGEGEGWQIDGVSVPAETSESSIPTTLLGDDLLSALASDVCNWLDHRRAKNEPVSQTFNTLHELKILGMQTLHACCCMESNVE